MAKSAIAITAGSGTSCLAYTDSGGTDHMFVKVLADSSGNLVTVSGNALDVNLTNAGTDIPVGGGVEATALRVTLASDSTGVLTVDGTVSVTDGVVLGAGTAEIGKLAAGTASIGVLGSNSGVDIGDVDVLSLPADVAVAEGGALGKGVLLQGDDGTDRTNVLVDTDGHLQVDILSGASGSTANLISTNNSTTSTLAGGAAYTGTGEDVSAYTSVTAMVEASKDSSTDGMTFQFSTDNTNWDDVYTFTYEATDGARRFQFPVTGQYFRAVYTNASGAAQTHFRLQTILHGNNVLTSIHRLADSVGDDRSATLVKSAILAQTSGAGDFIPIAANAQGKLQVASDTDVTGFDGNTPDLGDGAIGTGTLRVTMANNSSSLTVDSADLTSLGTAVVGDDTAFGAASDVGFLLMGVNTADTVDSGDRGAIGMSTDRRMLVDADCTGTVTANLGSAEATDIANIDTATTAMNGKMVAGTTIGGVELVATTSGGADGFFKSLDLDESEEEAKATAGQLYFLHCINLHTATIYLKVYDNTAAGVTVGTTVPDWTFPIPTQAATAHGAGFVVSFPGGQEFGTGITFAATLNAADADATSPGASVCILNAGYK